MKLYVLAGLGIGSLIGISTGVAAGGDAINGAFVFGPIGAIIGWLFALSGGPKPTVQMPATPELQAKIPEPLSLSGKLLDVVFVVFASLWNAHIDLLSFLRVLPTFVEKPWLFFVMAVVISAVFPPFLGIYLFAYLGASHFGLSETTSYRATIT